MSTAISTPVKNDSIADIQRVFALQQKSQWKVARSNSAQRCAKLQLLHDTMLKYRKEVETAVWHDLRKSPTETSISEMGVVCGEIRHTIKHLRSWMTERSVGTPITIFGSSAAVHFEPKGVCLILSPWNFPFNLTFSPLISAIAAGNTVILKPSEWTPHCSALMKTIVTECFQEDEIALFEGDGSIAQALTNLPFNHIFFTGSPEIGKVVMQAAAQNLSSVTLELGGKSPVIIDASANLDNAAAKIAWVKCMNAGQICTAPDYVLVPEDLHDRFVAKVSEKIRKFYGDTPESRRQSPDMCRLVHERHFDRVKSLLDDTLAHGALMPQGGNCIREEKFIDPAVLTNIPDQARIWNEEIFGPLLPIRTYKTLDDAIAYVNINHKPLAMYIFSNRRKNTDYIIRETRCGGVTVNDCSTHFYNNELPFGGSNNSGIGKTHGEYGFKDFSNERGVLRQTRFMPSTDLMLPPYGSKIAKWLLEGVVKYF